MMRLLTAILIALFAICAPMRAFAQDYDLVIRNGRIADGTGNPLYFADIGIKDGRIGRIGKIAAASRSEIDGSGLIVAPGFIDVHTHAENIVSLPLAENFVRMGVTTLVTGNCGGCAANIADFFKRIEEIKVSANVATLVGHNTVRAAAMGGSFNRAPADEELARMKLLVEQGMKDGAVGLSTGLIYLPGTFSKTEEIVELAKISSQYNGIYVSHMRNEGLEIQNALNELFRIAREAKIRAHVSHIKLSGRSAWGRADEVLAAIEQARAEGLDITQDQYTYTASSTGISMLIPSDVREGGRDRFTERISDPEQRARTIARMKESLRRGGRESYDYAVIANYPTDRSLNGKNIAEASRIKRGSDSLDEQIALILEIEKSGGAQGVFHGINEDDLQRFALHPNTMFASDSGVRQPGEGIPHPRGYGNNARVLARYVREMGLLRIEDAIRRMTSLPATIFRLRDRGTIREGAWADIVIFDPEKVQDTATFNDPHHFATGIVHTIVNGISVVKDGRHTESRPGAALRHRG